MPRRARETSKQINCSPRPTAASHLHLAFPGYTNAAAAGGHFTLDTTTLTNGLHTIGWLVTDSYGRADGVGSRFFTVANDAVMTAPLGAGRALAQALALSRLKPASSASARTSIEGWR